MDGLRRSESLTSSDSSELVLDQEETSSLQDFPATESQSTEWTDEKHSLYLKSMEASFVNQLYNSMDLLGWRSQNENLSDLSSRHRNSRTASGQFKVLRDGCWQKINFERPDFQLNEADESHGLLASPWIRHFRSAGKTHVVVSPSLQESASSESQAIKLSGKKAMSCGSDTSPKHFDVPHSHLCDHDLGDSNTEVSDQNFLDEDIKGEKASSICSSRKMKTLITDASSSDQVVPHNKRPITEDAIEKCLSGARQKTCTSDWHSEKVNGLSDGAL